MLKICSDPICRPLNIIFKTFLRTGKFPWDWISKLLKTTVLFHFYHRFVVTYLKDCFIINLCLTFFRKWFHTSKQWGFRPGESCINQLPSINHEILSAFDIGLEVWGLFLDVSKAFYKVWHAGLIYKLRQNGIYGQLINILNDFLTNKKQGVVLNVQCSSWVDVRAGVPQDSFLGLFYFWYMSVTYQMALKVSVSYLLMTLLYFP